MFFFFLAFFLSFIFNLLLVRYSTVHQKFTLDNQSGPQKVHTKDVARVGGIAIFGSLALTLIFRLYYFESSQLNNLINGLRVSIALCALPAFILGLAEDITKKAGIYPRLFGVAASAIAVFYYVPAKITHLGFTEIDVFLTLPLVSLIFTVFAISGLSNAYNLIDGFNGLASMVGILTLASITYVSFKNNDPLLVSTSLIMIGAIAGFFVWNYPNGRIFLGDGGAYLIGFFIAVLSILLVSRHESVSPFYALIVNAYPIFETLFTIWRRKVHRGRKSMTPDGIHFHSLIYRRILRWATRDNKTATLNNAKTSPYLWALSCITIVPATLWWNQQSILILTGVIFCMLYIFLYMWLVRFKSIFRKFS